VANPAKRGTQPDHGEQTVDAVPERPAEPTVDPGHQRPGGPGDMPAMIRGQAERGRIGFGGQKDLVADQMLAETDQVARQLRGKTFGAGTTPPIDIKEGKRHSGTG